MKKTKKIIFPLVGGMLGFGIHLVWHFFMGIELFYYGSHVVSGVIYTLLGTTVGAVIYLVVRKK